MNYQANQILIFGRQIVIWFIVIRRLMGSTDQADPSCFYVLQNFMNIDETTLGLFFLSPPLVAGPQKPQKLTTSKIKYEHFGPKILIGH